MPMETPAYVISAEEHSAALFRQTLQSMLAGSGVVGSGSLAVSQTTPTASADVLIAPGMVWIPGTQGGTAGMLINLGSQDSTYGSPLTTSFTDQGTYMGFNDASGGTTSVPIASNSSGNPRLDLIIAVVQDAVYSGSNNQVIITVVEGTPASSPSTPTCPNNCVVLAQVAVASGFTTITNSNITNAAPIVGRAFDSAATTASTIPGTSGWQNAGGFTTTNGSNIASAVWTCPRAGVYHFSLSMLFATSGSTSAIGLGLVTPGNTTPDYQVGNDLVTSAGAIQLIGNVILAVPSGHQYTPMLYNVSNTVTISALSNATRFQVARVSD